MIKIKLKTNTSGIEENTNQTGPVSIFHALDTCEDDQVLVTGEFVVEDVVLWTHSGHRSDFRHVAAVRNILDSTSKEGRNVLFNDALNTFYLWLYGVRHMVKDQ